MTGGARVVKAERSQLSWDLVDLDAWLPADHRARIVWAFVLTLNLDPLYAKIKAREGEAGRPAADPPVLLALWLYATIEGVGTAREVDRLSQSELTYRWLRGGVPLDYHTLADFRTENSEILDRLLSESLAALMAEGLVRPEEVIIDGTKVRAAAGKDSFKTAVGLAKAATLAAERVASLKAEVEADPAAQTRRRQAARERAAREAVERAARARAMLDRLAAEKEERAKTHKTAEGKKGEPSASLSDPEARMMRFADGAVRPGWNVQVAATSEHGFIVGIEATDRRNDTGLAPPMVEEIERRLAVAPSRIIVDGGVATQDDIVALAARAESVTVFAPVKPDRHDVTAHSLHLRAVKRAREPAALQEWRARMATADGEAVMRRRKRIELVNAHIKDRGLGRLLVRGLVKVRAVLYLHALAHNLMTAHRLRLMAAA
jgi:transposase/ribosomal protein L34